MEVDFLVSRKQIGSRHNISALEVKKTKRITISSLNKFKAKFSASLADSFVVHTGAYAHEDGLTKLPVYLLPFVL